MTAQSTFFGLAGEPGFVPPSGAGKLDKALEETEPLWAKEATPGYKASPPTTSVPTTSDPLTIESVPGMGALDRAEEAALEAAEQRPH